MFKTAINSIPLRPKVKPVNEERWILFSFHFLKVQIVRLTIDEINKKMFCALFLTPGTGD
jgi:hypothetical protein